MKCDWSSDRKSTRLNSSHTLISYAVFCLDKKRVVRSEEHTSELQSHSHLACRLLLGQTTPVATATAPRASSATLAHACRIGHPMVPGRRRFVFFNDRAPPEIYPLSLHDALPI